MAWDVGNGKGSQFSVKLSDKTPNFSEMWEKSTNNRMASTNQLDNTIYVGGMGSLRFVVAGNMTMKEGDTRHFRLRLSLVPDKIDVWGWVKYYRYVKKFLTANYRVSQYQLGFFKRILLPQK